LLFFSRIISCTTRLFSMTFIWGEGLYTWQSGSAHKKICLSIL